MMGSHDRELRIAELELKVKALAPKHIIRCDDYHAHDRIGIKWNLEARCCGHPCPGCDYEERVERFREARDG